MDHHNELKERITNAETRLTNIETRLAVAESNIQDIKEDLRSIKNNTTWILRLIIGAVIVAALGLVINNGGV